MERFCDNCGNKLNKEESFCDNCGKVIRVIKNRANKQDVVGNKLSFPTVLIKILPIVALAIFIGFLAINFGYGDEEVITSEKINHKKTFYTKSAANVRECPSLSCKIIGQYPQNTEFELSYGSIKSMPEWIEISWDKAGITTYGHMSKIVFSEAPMIAAAAPIFTATPKEPISKDDALSQDILNKIMQRTVKVKCYSSIGVVEGSGTIQAPSGGGTQWFIYTNLHVIGFGSVSGECMISLPQAPDYLPTEAYYATAKKVGAQFPDIDFAILEVNNSAKYFNEFPLSTCGVADIKIGDKVMVFGYPDFGGDSLTVTDGIVSGIEYTAYGPIYKTSAKIDEGNSGGLAIDTNSKCSIGMPTWAVSGAFEGLGYIQSWDMIIKSGNL